MISFFNRRELLPVFSTKKLYELQAALDAAEIEYQAKPAMTFGRMSGRGRGIPFQNPDTAHDYKIYVSREDFDRAMEVIQPILRSW